MTKANELLFNIGRLMLIAPIGLAIALAALHLSGAINAWVFPVVHIGIFCLFGGTSCLVAAQVIKPRRAQLAGRRRLLWGLAILLISLNLPPYLLAYHMTHVRSQDQIGLGAPKPQNTKTPLDRGLSYATRTVSISSSQWLETWEIPAQIPKPKGTVLLFHGNLGTKSSQLISPAQTFSALGFDTVLVDFQGGGGSSGNTVTLGIDEAEDVVTMFNALKDQRGDAPVILYGVSMGTAAILRAIAVHNITPDAVILELPFVRLVDAVSSRLHYHNIPTIPTAMLMVFWASIQHGVNSFGHNPIDYAKAVACPTLVIHGQQDKWTPLHDIEALVNNIPAEKQLVVSPEAGHHQLIGVDRPLWKASVSQFLQAV